MFNLKTPVIEISKIGSIVAKKLKKLEISTIGDFLYHFPYRYDDYRQILTIAQLKTRDSGVVRGKIKFITNKRSFKKRMIITEAIVSDSTDSIKVVWFNQAYLGKILKPGMEVYLAGKIEKNGYYGLTLSSPTYEIFRGRPPLHFGRLVPFYPLTANLSEKQIRFLIKTALSETKIVDWLPNQIKNKYHLSDLSFALNQIHFPKDLKSKELAISRLKFDEIFQVQLRNEIFKEKIKSQRAPLIKFKLKETQNFVKNLPFNLFDEQRKASWQIIKDLEKERPMNRLLEGEVGSGKTVVASLAILNVILNHYQVAYLVPTEILASQQFKNISQFLKGYKFKIALFTKDNLKLNQRKIKRPELIKKITKGEVNLVIGTHALIQKNIKFSKLGLIIVDEQHRFGVAQRQFLIARGTTQANTQINADGQRQSASSQRQSALCPHFLSMTATPIPRSVALVFYGDLDLSIIKEKPAGRKEVKTKIIYPVKSSEGGISSKTKLFDGVKPVYQFVKEEIKKGRQIFVVCPLIDPSDKLGVKSVKEEGKKLSKIFPEFKIDLLHGKLKIEEKNKIMADFLKNKINILVSTTVIEVGIDIPNTSIMMIENAERFGLAQLYQLRGRIGRGKHESFCFLMPSEMNEFINRRLKALIEAKNSLELAEKDLSFRGPGEIYGFEQSGFFKQFKLARFTDTEIIKKAKEATHLFLPLFTEPRSVSTLGRTTVGEEKFSSLSPDLDKIIYLE